MQPSDPERSLMQGWPEGAENQWLQQPMRPAFSKANVGKEGTLGTQVGTISVNFLWLRLVADNSRA